ncbi:MAG: hypothetical protein CM15mP26_2080 [Actinomycetota bacterium]|nr:MAG: hypothetical protein CM15mP26_2080 [Actinomycetota bacterium]
MLIMLINMTMKWKLLFFGQGKKNTLAYRSTNHVAIGAEMYELPIFTEYDDNGDLYIKIFPTMAPSLKDKEFLL